MQRCEVCGHGYRNINTLKSHMSQEHRYSTAIGAVAEVPAAASTTPAATLLGTVTTTSAAPTAFPNYASVPLSDTELAIVGIGLGTIALLGLVDYLSKNKQKNNPPQLTAPETISPQPSRYGMDFLM